MYYVYMIRCCDNSIYTGITTDIKRRLDEHKSRGKKCAKYTYNHIADSLICTFETENRSDASKLEYYIKRLKKMKKEELSQSGNLSILFKDKIDDRLYKFKLARD